MKRELILIIYFLGVLVAAASGSLILFAPGRFAKIMGMLYPTRSWSRWPVAAEELPPFKPLPRLLGLGMLLMAFIMLYLPLAGITSGERGTPSSSQPDAVNQSRVDVIALVGNIFLFLFGLYLFLKPESVLLLNRKRTPDRAIPKEDMDRYIPRVRAFLVLFMILSLYLIVRMFWR